MKKIFGLPIIVALVLAIAPLASMADTPVSGTLFSDDFSTGSTVNSLTPVKPTANSSSYEVVTRQNWDPAPSITTHSLRGGQGVSSAGILEFEALFATNAVTLLTNGDYIQLTITWTNSGLLTIGNSFLGFGLYNSAQVLPIPGGMNATLNNLSNYVGNGYAQGWQGYWGQVAYSGGTTRISGRLPQTGTDNRNQDLVSAGSGNTSYANPARIDVSSSGISSTVVLADGSVYTDVLTIRYNGAGSVTITNALYAGYDTSGTVLSLNGGRATNAQYTTSSYDALAAGFYEKTTTTATNTMDIYSIQVTGQGTMLTGPPQITSQPVAATVATNGACAFAVTADGVAVSYQWHRNGTNLLNGPNISGANSSALFVSSAGLADAVSGANGYYVTCSSAGGFTNSMTNSLTLRPGTNLVWTGLAGGNWDLNNTASWKDADGNSTVFNYGDSVSFSESPATRTISLTGSFLTASSVTFSSSANYTMQGSGSFAGPGQMIYTGTGGLDIKNANTYTGGTIISNQNDILNDLFLENYNGLGTGPITLLNGLMEVVPAGSATLGFKGDIVVANDFTIQFNTNGAFSGVFFGNLSGTAGKTLTLTPASGGTTNRFRIYGTNTVYNANLLLVGNASSQAAYDGTVMAPYHSAGSQTYNGIISGNGGLIQRDSGTTILNGANTYAGGTFATTPGMIALGINTTTDGGGNVTSGPIGTGPLYVAPELGSGNGSGQVAAWGGDRTIANPIKFPSATNNQVLIIGGTYALNFTAPFALNGQDGNGTNNMRYLQVTNTALTTLSGVVSDGGLGFGLTKSGIGVLALNTTETYTGPTIVSNGTLRVDGALDVGSAVTVATNATLGGTGTINGPVTIQTGGVLAPGASIGTLTISNNLTVNGNLSFELSKGSPSTNDICFVRDTLANTGTGVLYVTNLGSALSVGDKFKLFNKAMTGGGSLTVSNLGSSVLWSNGLAVDGSITVLPSAPPSIITQPVSQAVAQSSTVNLSVTASTVTGVTNYLWQMNSNTIAAGNVSGTATRTLTITGFQAANAGYYRVVVGDGNLTTNSANAHLTVAVAPTIANSGVSGTTLSLQIPTEFGPTYLVQTNGNLTSPIWQTAATIIGDGTVKPFSTIITSSPELFIRVKVQ
jgi:autotransporter-associated beta strand protein